MTNFGRDGRSIARRWRRPKHKVSTSSRDVILCQALDSADLLCEINLHTKVSQTKGLSVLTSSCGKLSVIEPKKQRLLGQGKYSFR